MADGQEVTLDPAKDEKEIEALIQRELDALGENDLDDFDAADQTRPDVQTDSPEVNLSNRLILGCLCLCLCSWRTPSHRLPYP